MKSINIGLIGFGNIGSGVYNLLKKNSGIIKERTGIELHIKSICDIRTDYVKEHTQSIPVTSRWEDIVNDDAVDIVIELIGGIEPAKTIITAALKKGKNVVTANKKLLAEQGKDIFDAANASGAGLAFEAAVGGGIPCILSLKQGLVANTFKSITGILNGTTNYILTKMQDTGAPFEEALKDAQQKGFAEADPTFDIEGFDAGHKIAILAMLAYNKCVDYKSISIEGITRIEKIDMDFAKDMGYIIKLLGIAKLIGGELDIRVHPTMLPEKHPMASVRNEYNAVMYHGDMTDPITLTGKGAGSFPTASAVVGDAVRLSLNEQSNESGIVINGEAKYIVPDHRVTRYYIRIQTLDRPGILAQIAGILGDNKISIASVIQKEVNSDHVPMVIMTHQAHESAMFTAIKTIQALDFIKDRIMLIRVEDSN